MVCPECGTDNKPGARMCELCGKPLAAEAPLGPPVSQRQAEARKRLEKRRRMERITGPILGVVILILIGLIAWQLSRIPKGVEDAREEIAADYPVAALTNYLTALCAGDATTAYGLLATPLKSQITEAQFAQVETSGPSATFQIKDSGEFDPDNVFLAASVGGQPRYYTLTREAEGWRVTWTPKLGEALAIEPRVR